MTNIIESTFLTILIPTYNRSAKLHRLLKILLAQRELLSEPSEVRLLVSNDCSRDDTAEMLSNVFAETKGMEVINQPTNLGQDGNVRKLYEAARSEYVWFFSDDDIPLEDALQTVINTLKKNRPDGLLFSFSQPPGSPDRQFNYKEEYYETSVGTEIVAMLRRYPKISIYVLKRGPVPTIAWGDRLELEGSNWFFFAAVDYVFSAQVKPKLGAVSRQLASADEDWDFIRLEPHTWGALWKISRLPYFRKAEPRLQKQLEVGCILSYVDFLFKAKIGTFRLENSEAYDLAIADLSVPARVLIRNPGALVKAILLKLKWTDLYVRFRGLRRQKA